MNTETKAVGMQKGQQMRITDNEKKIIAATFKNNDQLVGLMRKMFLPEVDPHAPIGQIIDLYMTINTKDRTPEDIAVDLIARNLVIGHVENVLMQLDLISKLEATTPEEAQAKLTADSAK